MRIDLWSDVVCPWCWIGKRRLEQALERFPHDVEVVWHSFELDPSTPGAKGGRYVDRLAEKYGRTAAQAQQMLDQMTATGATEGLDFRFDRAVPSGTFDAHRLLHLGLDRGVQAALKDRLMRATFSEGEDVSDAETLVRLAVEVGLDEAEVRGVLASGAYADAVRADEAQARAYGITGVPFFVVDGKYGVSGAQPADVLLQVLDRALAERTPVVVASGPGCDGDACAV